jgi:predicted SAM-dependent methyltransferase
MIMVDFPIWLKRTTQAKRKSLTLLTVILLLAALLFFPAQTKAVRHQLAKSSMITGAYSGAQQDIAALRNFLLAMRSPSMIEKYVREHPIRKLQIGAGSSRLQGWLNTDIVMADGLAYLDATKRFPLEDDSFHYVFSEHVIEHLSYEDGMKMLKESYRILVPGGKIRIATPNLERLVALFQKDRTEEMRRYMREKIDWHQLPNYPTGECFILNLELGSFGHIFVYDPDTLRFALTNVGFQSVQQFNVGESDDPQLRDDEIREHVAYKDINRYETMVLQAIKPRGQPPA